MTCGAVVGTGTTHPPSTLPEMLTSLPTLQVRHSDTSDGETWVVRATWEDGTFEEISGFRNEAEADDWITNKFQIWLDEINKARGS
jgi:hypothetical protein